MTRSSDSGRISRSWRSFSRVLMQNSILARKAASPVTAGIRGLRFPVSRLLGLLAAGQTREEILKAYSYLESADIEEALAYAASLAEDETVEIVTGWRTAAEYHSF